ncbi:MAG: HAMP domain-containing histidine kinase [Rhizobiaceae bacterium]|nr:HAMP domain-containing histidine kinase [Rhizobiaceae bacterium]
MNSLKNLSLKRRFLILQVLLIVAALAITGYGLILLFERHVERRINAELDTYLTQIAARVGFDEDGTPHLAARIADPRFEKIFSGLYWLIYNETSDKSSRSRSLWDSQMQLPADVPELGVIHIHTTSGPQNSSLLVHERRLVFNGVNGEQIARLAVAIDLVELKKAVARFANEVTLALIALGSILLLAGWIQVTIGLRPLSFVRDSIANVRNGKATRVDSDLPHEVSPLAEEVNYLLEAQEITIQRAKSRADNLAHGFKTPLTALISDIRRLRDKGEVDIANDIEAISLVFRRQIERELTTSRIRHTKTMANIKILPIINQIVATLQRTPDGEGKTIEVDCNEDIVAQIDKDDLAEILGNLLENSLKHAADQAKITVVAREDIAYFKIEDNGKGISGAQLEMAQERGVRLDQSISGSGLGLAIVNDVLDIYGQKLELGKSSMGGLKASFQLRSLAI